MGWEPVRDLMVEIHNGDTTSLTSETVTVLHGTMGPGSRCQAQYGDGNWYPATVMQFNGQQYLVQWDGNGAQGWVQLNQVSPA